MSVYRLYVFDLDGTLFRGMTPLPGAVESVAALRAGGALIRYLTNNSGQTRASYLEKLTGMGFEAHPEEVWHTGLGAAMRCHEEGWRRAYVIGEPGLSDTLVEAGIEVLPVDQESGADVVIAGICRMFTYARLNAALQHLRAGSAFVATNTDATYPVEGGRLEPGAGSLVAAVATASGRSPEVIGKPNPFLVREILREAGVEPAGALVVGDRLETDIECGRRAGCPTWLVLTGVIPAPIPGQPGSQDLRGVP